MSYKLPRAAAEELGIPSAAIIALIDAWEKKGGIHSFMLLRHGKTAAEGWWKPYSPEKPHMLFSLSKSFTSIASAFAVSEGLLDYDAPVLSFFPEYADIVRCPAENTKKMRVCHLLSMCTGHVPNADFIFEYDDCVSAFLTSVPQERPGARFSYNTGATYMISAIINKVTGMKTVDYLRPRLFGPLGIENITWDECARGISYGGFGLNVKTEDIAKFGQFLLNRGEWEGKQLLPAHLIDAAAAKHINNREDTKYPELDDCGDETLSDEAKKSDWAQGYGRQFWRCVPQGVYRGDGAFGQLCVVMPEYDAVLAVTAGTGDMQAELDAVWECLIPAFADKPLPRDCAAETALAAKLNSLNVGLPAGGYDPDFCGHSRTYQLTSNSFGFRTIRFETGLEHDTAYITCNDGSARTLFIGHGEWIDNNANTSARRGSEPLQAKLSPPAENDDRSMFVSAAGAAGQNSYRLRAVQNRTPFIADITFEFDGERMTAQGHFNVGFSGGDIKFNGCAVKV
jgi:CubicO group peptidase (beta-lactamase class C family)